MAATAAGRDRIAIDDESELRWWTDDGSTEYGFCGRCGSSMFWRAAAEPETWSIAAGTLDVPTGLRTTQAWWCDTASDYVRLPDDVVGHPRDG